jgi:hypothetical protein
MITKVIGTQIMELNNENAATRNEYNVNNLKPLCK